MSSVKVKGLVDLNVSAQHMMHQPIVGAIEHYWVNAMPFSRYKTA